MADIIDVMYRFRNMASIAASSLRTEVKAAQEVLDRLDKFADDAEEGVEPIAASDLHPTHSSTIPARSGLVRRTTKEGE